MSAFRMIVLGKTSATETRTYDYSNMALTTNEVDLPASGQATDVVLYISIPFTVAGDSTKYVLSNYPIKEGIILPGEKDTTKTCNFTVTSNTANNGTVYFSTDSSNSDGSDDGDVLNAYCASRTTVVGPRQLMATVGMYVGFGTTANTFTTYFFQEANDIVSCDSIAKVSNSITRLHTIMATDTYITVTPGVLTVSNPVFTSGATTSSVTLSSTDIYNMGYVTVGSWVDDELGKLNLLSSNTSIQTNAVYPLTGNVYALTGANTSTTTSRTFTVTLKYMIGATSKSISTEYTQFVALSGGISTEIDPYASILNVSPASVDYTANSVTFQVVAYNCTWTLKVSNSSTITPWYSISNDFSGSFTNNDTSISITQTAGKTKTTYNFTITINKNSTINSRRIYLALSNTSNTDTDSATIVQSGDTSSSSGSSSGTLIRIPAIDDEEQMLYRD